MTAVKDSEVFGVVAEFENPSALLGVARKLRDGGYKRYDCHSPFPIHGMDEAMGLKNSPVGYIAGAGGLTGFIVGLGLQWWTSAVDYPIIISGKPFFSYQAFVPVTFGLTILFAAIGAIFGMLAINRLPQLHHGVFDSERFCEHLTNDGFFVSIEAEDKKFDSSKTAQFLESLGGKHVEVIGQS